jgi:hypothetical protein
MVELANIALTSFARWRITDSSTRASWPSTYLRRSLDKLIMTDPVTELLLDALKSQQIRSAQRARRDAASDGQGSSLGST